MSRSHFSLALAALFLTASACRRNDTENRRQVVVYTALDRSFSEPILTEFERRTGIRTFAVYDTESTKSVGLTNRIRAERNRPRCDVFWNNEILNTLLLKHEGLLRPIQPANAAYYPESMKDADGTWFGFAARARVLIVNTTLVHENDLPRSMYDLVDPKWAGRIGIAKPVAGTAATHAACLFQRLGNDAAQRYFRDLLANDVQIESGNKSCAERVGSGTLALAWTDTDDAVVEIDSGSPVVIVYPDIGPDKVGTLFIPNTLAAVRNSPHPAEAVSLIDFLLSAEIETRLARGSSAQIPLNRQVNISTRLKRPDQVQAMVVDFTRAATQWNRAQHFIHAEFIR